MMTDRESQLASSVLMIRPARFQSNPQTAESNRFQGRTERSAEDQQAAALLEFDSLVSTLRENGVNVVVADDTPEPHTPDAVFPNNWVSFHADGRVVLYPMEAENRRTERRADIIDALNREHEFQIREVLDLSHHESSGHFLEGTGSMVFDRINRVAYAGISTRTSLGALGDFAQRMDYDVVAFDAQDNQGAAIYHTNVLMSLGESVAVICDESIVRDDQRSAVLERLRDSGRAIVSLSFEQLQAFSGNMLELRSQTGERLFVMSQQAFDSLDASQLDALKTESRIVSVSIDNIEQSAGGSVRCMLAEIHLPRHVAETTM